MPVTIAGEDEKAAELLRNIDDFYARGLDNDSGRHPSVLSQRALNKAMLGDTGEAARLMSLAVDSGLRGYYSIKNDPLRYEFLELPPFKSTMSRVLSDIERQRVREMQTDSVDGFRDYVQQLMTQKRFHLRRSTSRMICSDDEVRPAGFCLISTPQVGMNKNTLLNQN